MYVDMDHHSGKSIVSIHLTAILCLYVVLFSSSGAESRELTALARPP